MGILRHLRDSSSCVHVLTIVNKWNFCFAVLLILVAYQIALCHCRIGVCWQRRCFCGKIAEELSSSDVEHLQDILKTSVFLAELALCLQIARTIKTGVIVAVQQSARDNCFLAMACI